jgi:hypothetical protein
LAYNTEIASHGQLCFRKHPPYNLPWLPSPPYVFQGM